MSVSLILACAGKGERAGFNQNKLLVSIDGKTIIERTLYTIYNSGLIDDIFVVVAPFDQEQIVSIIKNAFPNALNGKNRPSIKIITGGQTRTESVNNALREVESDIVLIHDGARPYLTNKLIKDCIDGAMKFGGVIPVIPTSDTIVKVEEDCVENYLGKGGLYSVQTPQAFFTSQIKEAYSKIGDNNFNDDGEVYKNCFGKVNTILGEKENVKLTFQEDFNVGVVADRCGTGFDCHRLVENRKLILGGIEIKHDKGLLGHSDADVVAHAVMDSMLSACALRDIGYYFPDNDEKYKDADSMKLLEIVVEMVKEKGYAVKNVSVCIMAEKPKLKNYIPLISQNLANALAIHTNDVGVSATTLEGLGFVGREEGICVSCSVLLKKF